MQYKISMFTQNVQLGRGYTSLHTQHWREKKDAVFLKIANGLEITLHRL